MSTLEIVAEVAQGFEGKRDIAALLIRAAAAAGASAVKFQLVYADELATPDYQHYALFKALEMGDDVWKRLRSLASNSGIDLMLDVYGNRSLRLAQALACPAVKIHTTDMMNFGLLNAVAKSIIPRVMLSAAGCSDEEITDGLNIMRDKDVVLLHGFQGYPTPLGANRIARIPQLRRLLAEHKPASRSIVGFADHAPSGDSTRFLLPAAAIGAGAMLIEKHLTLSPVMKFEDYEAAMGPDEFADFAEQMKACFVAMAYNSAMHESELDYRKKARKHVVAARSIQPGETIEPDMIQLLRTASSSPIYDARAVYGKRCSVAVDAGSAMSEGMLAE